MLTPNLEVRDGERPHRRCAALLLSQPGHLVLLHLYPVIDQAGLLQLPDLGAEPAVNININIIVVRLLILVSIGRVLGQSKGYTKGGERLVHDGHV